MDFKVKSYKDLIHEMMEKSSPYDEDIEPVTEATRKIYEKEFYEIRTKFGTDVLDFFNSDIKEDDEVILEALNTVISWKIINGKRISKLESAITGLYALEAEVYNGGFHQYFFNSSGDHWKDLFDVISLIGDEEAEQSFKGLISIFGDDGPSTDRGERWQQLKNLEEADEEQMWGHFDRHSSEYYEHPFPDMAKFFEFIKANSDAVKIEMI